MRHPEIPASPGESANDLEFRLRLAGARLRAAQQEKLEATVEFLAARKLLTIIHSEPIEDLVSSQPDSADASH